MKIESLRLAVPTVPRRPPLAGSSSRLTDQRAYCGGTALTPAVRRASVVDGAPEAAMSRRRSANRHRAAVGLGSDHLVEIDIESGETQRTLPVLSPAVVAVDGA